MQYNEILGRGAFKSVYKAYDHEEGIEVAWNKLETQRMPSTEKSRLFAEIRILRSLNHDSILQFHNSWVSEGDNGTVDFITEIMTSGTLKQ